MSDTVATAPAAPPTAAKSPLTTAALLLLPLLLLGVVIAVFATTSGGLTVEPVAPINKLDVERKIVTDEGFFLYVRNVGPQELTIAQVIVNDAIWPATVSPSPT